MGDGEQENRSGSEQSSGSNGKEGRKRESEGTHGKRAEGDRERSRAEAMGGGEGKVYFIETHDSFYLKIGFSTKVPERFLQLSTLMPGLKLIGYILGNTTTEAELHRRYSSLRVNGEWFRQADELRAFIASLDLLHPPARLSQEARTEADRKRKEEIARELRDNWQQLGIEPRRQKRRVDSEREIEKEADRQRKESVARQLRERWAQLGISDVRARKDAKPKRIVDPEISECARYLSSLKTAKTTPEQRKAIAKKANAARWGVKKAGKKRGT